MRQLDETTLVSDLALTASDTAAAPLASREQSQLVRELRAVREIAHAFLMAERAADVYQFALDRVTPLIGAAFSLIMQIGGDGELLRPVAQHEWPAKHRDWIGALRVRVGDGPSGLAVERRELIEVADLFADPALELWYPVAEELGFRSILAAPLVGANGPVGAIAFYFSDPTAVSDEHRALVRLVAEQLAATADRAVLIEALRRANAALAEANASLEREIRSADAARRRSDQFLGALLARIAEARGEESVQTTTRVANELAQHEREAVALTRDDVDPRAPLLNVLQFWRGRLRAIALTHGEPTVLLPTMHTDGAALERLLQLLTGQVLQRATANSNIYADVELGRGFVAHRFEWNGAPMPDLSQSVGALAELPMESVPRDPSITALDLALAVALVRRLGGEVQCDEWTEEWQDESNRYADDSSGDASRPTVAGPAQGVTLVFRIDETGG